jgi:copper ion binding protein
METKIFQVEGMSCQHCVHSIKTAVGGLKGVGNVEVDLQGKKVTVELDPNMVTVDTVKETIEDQGYDVR